MPVSGVKPYQFSNAQSDQVDDVHHHREEGTGMVDHGEPEQLFEGMNGAGIADNDNGILANEQVTGLDRVEIDDAGGREVNDAVDPPPVGRSKRIRKPNSKYDPAIFDLDSVEIRSIPLSGKKNEVDIFAYYKVNQK